MSGIETNQSLAHYIISFLLGDENLTKFVQYSDAENFSSGARIIIKDSGFFDDGIYGTQKTLPKVPFSFLPGTDIPFLFGEPKIKIDENGKIILFADLVASAYFLLSRYEEIIKPECRDKYGRFLAKDSVVFQQGFGFRPLVDEWGRYLRNLLRESGIEFPPEKHGFRKIYLTHDVDNPFKIYRKEQIPKQWVKNIIRRGKHVDRPLYTYFHPENDSSYTFPKIISCDEKLRRKFGEEKVEPIYFVISAGSKKTKEYCDINLKKFQNLLELLSCSGATIGLHVSYEAGENPKLIKNDMERLFKYCRNATTKSRHHFLRWTRPEDIDDMEKAGITEDFTLEYADSAGFRAGTCRPYHFINPRTKRISNIIEHPMQIMECSLDRLQYMNLPYSKAFEICRQLVDSTFDYNGELVLLFHNPIFSDENYYGKLYLALLEYIENLK